MDESGKKNKPLVRSVWVKSAKKPQDSFKAVEKSPEFASKEPQEEQSTVHPSTRTEPAQNVEVLDVSQRSRNNKLSARSVWVVKRAPESRERLPGKSVEGLQSEQLISELSSSSTGSHLEESQCKQPSSCSSLAVSLSASVMSVSVVEKAPELVEARPEESMEGLQEEQLIGGALTSCGAEPSGPSSGSNSEGGDELHIIDQKNKSELPVYAIPEDLTRQFWMDVVPEVLHQTLSLSNYGDYFSALLYAEDFHIEKWSTFLMYRVTLEVVRKGWRKGRKKNICKISPTDDKVYILFEITSIPEKRPYLLSRDYVFVRRSGRKNKFEKFEGRLIRVEKSTHVVVEFGSDFLLQYSPSHKYDVSFSFNRSCLKRSHQAVEAALFNPSFHHVLFPSSLPRTTDISTPSATFFFQSLDADQISVIHSIMQLKGPPPYLINGPISVTKKKSLSKVGTTILEAIFQIYSHMDTCRILVVAPKNLTCDTLISRLSEIVPESDLFRANAIFREIKEVPDDVLPLCSYDGECFSNPSLHDLQKFRVIVSTTMTCFRLKSSGISAGYFTHIFMVDASFATEPETMVALANFVGYETAVVITGSQVKFPHRGRSKIARENGLERSYFHRLIESELYSSNDPACVCYLAEQSKS